MTAASGPGRKAAGRKKPDGSKKRQASKASLGARKAFPLVGIGASAGGLEAFTQLLAHLPEDTGMGYVLIQHLDPNHESMLTEILSRATRMPVRQVARGMRIEPDNVYVIPPGTIMSLVDGTFRLAPSVRARGREMPIDFFLHSLAENYRSQAIGVILSGTLSDGALGLKAIKAEGGVTFAQDEKSARFQDMPQAAIAAGSVDFILPPEGIARELTQIGRHPYVALPRPSPDERPAAGSAQERVFAILKRATGVDFRSYRQTTIKRRVSRRMVLNKIDGLAEYVDFLRQNPGEVNALYEDILIRVTGFFRDPEAFQTLKRRVFPALLQDRSPHDPIRVWVPGCSTGEEVYSIAISLFESLGDTTVAPQIQIFATDISDSSIERARSGIYLENSLVDVSPERVRRFFVKVDHGYQICRAIRDVCVFARQNLAADPPFSNLDLLSCRNVLIYLEPSLQKRVLPHFHYALKPDGFLMLGGSESIGGFSDLFQPVDRHERIFSKKAGSSRQALDFGRAASRAREEPMKDGIFAEAALKELDLSREIDRVILSRYAPAAVVVNEDMDVVQFRGRVSQYLEPASGAASFNVLKMAREGLVVDLRSALVKAKKKGARIRVEDVRIREDGTFRRINLEVVPVRSDSRGSHYYLVLFEDVEDSGGRKRAAPPAEPRAPERRGGAREDIARLEQELTATKEYLQAIIEEQEASNEELKSANEEILSSNEELQSTNEELETAKEELQSTNEELTTLNEEMHTRNSELTVLNDDLSNLLSAITVPIVMIGLDGRIRRFTQPAEKLFNLIATDAGRPFRDIKHNVAFPGMDETIRQVMDTVTSREHEVQDRDGRWYQMRVRPYWTLDKRVDGAVLVLSDIDPIKRSLEEVTRAREFADSLIETVRESLVVLDDDRNVRRANSSFYATFQGTPDHTEGRPLFELSDWKAKAEPLLEQTNGKTPREAFVTGEIEVDFESLGRRSLLLNARRIQLPGEAAPLILLAIEDVTERRDAELLLRASEGRYRQLFESAREGILIVDADSGMALDVNPFLLQIVGCEMDEVLGKKPWELPFAADAERMRTGFRELTANSYAFDPDLELRKKGGGAVHVEALSSVYYLGTQKVAQYNLRDITARREAEREARRQKDFTGRVVDSSLDGILAFDRNENLIVWNIAMERILGVRREEAVGRNAFEVLPFFEEIGERQFFRKALAGEASVSEDRPYVSQTGREGFFEGHYSPLRDESGAIIGGLAVIREITSRKQFEEHLRQVQKLESLGTLSGGIAHDFNNLLNIISAYAALLAKDSGKKSPAHLEAINRAVDRGAALVRQLLTFARKSEVQFEIVEPNAVAEELKKLLRETFPRKFDVAVETAPDLPKISADPNQLHQALLNLCVNARDAMPKGGKLRIRTSLAPAEELRKRFSEAADTDYVLFSVKDTGGGIDEETRARLFEPFFTTKEKGRGAGLGLALVYGIVKSHLGFIDVESQVGRGAEFRIYLPVESGHLEESRPRARARRETPIAQGGSETILFAEDEEMLASAVKSLLESEGYRVLTAKDGQEALEIYGREGKEIDISILDLQMPRLGGWETFQKLRELDPRARIVIASGDLDRQQRLEMENAGMDGSLRKPYSAGQVMRTVRRILDR